MRRFKNFIKHGPELRCILAYCIELAKAGIFLHEENLRAKFGCNVEAGNPLVRL